ncbi:M20/M25/M40 family metallo-hydrolase [Sphingomonas sp. NPDC092331]|jgi:carboxypeptidase Q|uniref:M20/M25/M40 family metallo-hydrolase n=1 Tax=unclassified Sphingomonas TaxID=196159 RepID=UPI0029F1DF62|nr:M20/M25/M40 family metallo-hydrolase [Pseudomonadota bacterium]
MRRLSFAIATLLAATATAPLATAKGPDGPSAPVDQIVDQGTRHSEVMRIAQYLTDVIGGRLTNSPGMRQAEDWTQAKFREWGLVNVHKEGFEFGRGWSARNASVKMVAPRPLSLIAAPLAWTPGTGGPITGQVVLAPMADEAALDQYKGKLKGKIVLITEPTDIADATVPDFRRYGDADLDKADTFELPSGPSAATRRPRGPSRQIFLAKRDAFLKAEGAIAYATMSSRNGKLIHGQNSQFRVGATPPLPGFEIAAEDYRRLVRLAKMGATPSLELNSDVTYDDSDTKAYNIMADIPGTDAKAGYVMAGAHMDSWAMGDGAADNAAGVSMVMEAARIIKTLGVRTKRAIRFVLWSGEEQGLLGSMAYIEGHVATRTIDPTLTGPARYAAWGKSYPIKPGPDHAKLAAYFNLDNGSGKIRGIYTQGNTAVVPIFRDWLAPFSSFGATKVATALTDSTDHVFFDVVGIPAFQFIQDPLDYASTVHHTDVDTFDHLKPEDMRQGAIILAAFLINAANTPDPLPRVPLATQPKTLDEFYPAPGAK